MSIESIREQAPFLTQPHEISQSEIGSGGENSVRSIIFHPGTEEEKEYVLKQPTQVNYFSRLREKSPPSNNKESNAISFFEDYWESRQRFLDAKDDYRYMTQPDVLGKFIPPTHFVMGAESEENPHGVYILQDFASGETWNKYAKRNGITWESLSIYRLGDKTDEISENTAQFMKEYRDPLIELIGGAKKTLIELGAVADIWSDNLIFDGKGNITMIDPGTPSVFSKYFDELCELPMDMRSVFAKNMMMKLTILDDNLGFLDMSEDETAQMYRNAGITKGEYEQAREELIRKCVILNGD